MGLQDRRQPRRTCAPSSASSATKDSIREKPIAAIPGVESVTPVLKPYKLVAREFRGGNDSVVKIGDVAIGGRELVIMSGPCSVESQRADHLHRRATCAKAGARVLRGGAFKPRTSPYAFQGLGVDGLKLLAEAREETGLPVITEIMDTKDLDVIEQYADCLQVGARNMQNFSLLKEVGRSKLPVMLKRGMSATIKDLLMSAEYILSEGNFNVLLCERGIRTFETYTRNTLDLNAVPVLKKRDAPARRRRSHARHRPARARRRDGPRRRRRRRRRASWSKSTTPPNSPRATANRRCCPTNSPTSSAASAKSPKPSAARSNPPELCSVSCS